MPPKKGAAKKGAKGKNLDDDEFWEKKGAGSGSALAVDADDVDVEPVNAKAKKSAYELLEEFEAGGGEDDDEGGGGGLLSAIKRTGKDRKKPKAKASAPLSDDEEFAPAPAAAVVADIDDEWPEEDVKPKKGKKGGKQNGKAKKGGKKAVEEDEDDVEGYDLNDGGDILAPVSVAPVVADVEEERPEEDVKPKRGGKADKKKGKKQKEEINYDLDDESPAAPPSPPIEIEEPATPAPAPITTADPVDADSDQEDADAGDSKLLSKKEKEKLKKEKEKAKKKAQAAKKKGGAPEAGQDDDAPELVPVASAPAVEEPGPDDNEAEGEGGAGGSKNKKKKKKAAPVVEEKPVSAKKGKVNAQVAALQAAMEKQRQMEAEIREKAEAERVRIEEEERKAEEEERLAEEAKALRKEKEKAKREQARKEGRLLTPKQKADKAAAEARKKALLASGFIIEGLQEGASASTSTEKPKKVVYGNKKKPAAKKADTEAGPSQPAPAKIVEPVVETPAPPPSKAAPAEGAEDDDWDKSDQEAVEELTRGVNDTKITDDDDDWDQDSGDEKPAAKAPPVANGSTKAAVTPSAATNGKPVTKSKAAVPEDSDESDDDSDDSSDDDSDDSSDDSDSEEELTPAQRKAAAEAEKRKAEATARRAQRHQEALAARSKDDLRSPICCILGHVDTGKTKLLDKIRQTNVQEGEAGGITQQIGATYFPVDAIKTKTEVVNRDGKFDYKIPGLLIIDTPGHESFTNLRTRGSSLCNIAILVVDITHGLEPQTLESIRLLKERKTPFVVALNKIDRCYGWDPTPNGAFRESFDKQSAGTKREFENRLAATKVAFAEQGFNSVLFDENKDLGRNVSLVPTSAITGEGIPDMIMLLVKLTQQRMTERLMYLSELECTVLEVKVIEGLGTTIDVILSNGVMREGDRIVVCGLNGPIVTNVRALLTPQALREMRVKSVYVHNKEVKAALGVKISAPGLEKAIAGSRLLVVGPDDDEEELIDEVMSDLKGLEEYVDKTGKGVWVQASTLGSLEALLEFLRSSKIPVMGVNIGPVYKRDIMRCAAMLEKAPEYAVVLCFDVPVEKEAKSLAEELNVKVFEAQIIYHLFDAFTAYMANVLEIRRKDAAPNAVWPCRLKVIAAFAKRDPIVLGVDIIEGSLRVGTPVCVVKVDKTSGKKEIIPLGKITSIEINHATKDVVKKSQIGGGAAIKIEHAAYQSAKAYGRHFDDTDEIISHITRASIDILKSTFREQTELTDWALIKALKPKLDIA